MRKNYTRYIQKGLESYDWLKIYFTYLQNQGRFFCCNFMARKNIYNTKKIISYPS